MAAGRRAGGTTEEDTAGGDVVVGAALRPPLTLFVRALGSEINNMLIEREKAREATHGHCLPPSATRCRPVPLAR